MREIKMKRLWIRLFGLTTTILLLALFWRWGLSRPVTAYAFSQDFNTPAVGTALDNTSIEGGYIQETDQYSTITLYYQIYGEKENLQVAISGYSYSGQGSLDLRLPAFIRHGEGTESAIYSVVGVNGGVFANFSYLNSVTFAPTYEWIGAEAFMNCPLSQRGIGFQELRVKFLTVPVTLPKKPLTAVMPL